MTELIWCLAVLLLGSLLAGMLRVVLGPTAPDRMLATQLMGTTGVGVVLLLSELLSGPSLVDVALVFSLFAAMTTVAFVRLGERPETAQESCGERTLADFDKDSCDDPSANGEGANHDG